MNRIILTLFLGTGMLCAFSQAEAQENKEHLKREFTISGKASDGTLLIYNISGSIKVEGTTGNKVVFEIEKTISADNENDLQTGIKEFRTGFQQKGDSIIAYIAEPFDSRPGNQRNGNIDIDYEYNLDYTVKIPAGMNIRISTVNNGSISVNNVTGNLHVNNVNDEISITNAKGKTLAQTVNGDVTVSYTQNPVGESSYKTINGDINVSYKPDLSADLQFKSMNGEFFTDFPNALPLPSSTRKVSDKKGNSSVYKLESTTSVRFGNGGSLFRFETLNGNVYIRKQS